MRSPSHRLRLAYVNAQLRNAREGYRTHRLALRLVGAAEYRAEVEKWEQQRQRMVAR